MFATQKYKLFLWIAVSIFVLSGVLLGVFGLNLGIDFTGGSLTEVAYDSRPDKQEVEVLLTELDLGGFSLRETKDETGRDGYILRTRDLSEPERQAVERTLLAEGAGGGIGRFTSIGPVIGEELRSKAVWAIGAVVLVIVLYVAFAFRGIARPVRSWVYGLITILALLHDVLVPTAIFGMLGTFVGAEVDVLFVMAILAVLGYSVNDTIVVFDRVRENLAKNKENNTHELFAETVGRSLQQTYTRSINTSVTTLLALFALLFLGGDVTQNFALVLIIGVVAGTYSSLFVAPPLLVAIEARNRAKHTKS